MKFTNVDDKTMSRNYNSGIINPNGTKSEVSEHFFTE